MSNTRDEYRALGIINAHQLVSAARDAGVTPAVYLAWQAQVSETLRYTPAGYSVVRPGFKTDNGKWNGHKFFFKRKGADAEGDAKAWASENFGVSEWVKLPGFPRDWFPAEVAAFAKALLKASK